MARQEERHQAAIKEFPHFAERRVGFIAGAEWADANPDGKMLLHVLNKSAEQAKKQMIDKACDAYCKVCGHFAHTVPTHICRHDCRYFSDFRKAMEE